MQHETSSKRRETTPVSRTVDLLGIIAAARVRAEEQAAISEASTAVTRDFMQAIAEQGQAMDERLRQRAE